MATHDLQATRIMYRVVFWIDPHVRLHVLMLPFLSRFILSITKCSLLDSAHPICAGGFPRFDVKHVQVTLDPSRSIFEQLC